MLFGATLALASSSVNACSFVVGGVSGSSRAKRTTYVWCIMNVTTRSAEAARSCSYRIAERTATGRLLGIGSGRTAMRPGVPDQTRTRTRVTVLEREKAPVDRVGRGLPSARWTRQP